jgi:hypothetical protein
MLRWKVGDGGGVTSLVVQGEEDVFPLFRSFDVGDDFCFWKLRDEGRSTDPMYIFRIIKASYKFQKVICFFNQRSQIFLTQQN